MKRGVLIGVIIIVVLAVGATAAYLQAGQSASRQNSTTPTVVAEESTPAPKGQPGAYVDYSDTVIADTKGTKLLFFHAPWCPQCRSLETSIKATMLPEGVTIIKTDYDSHQALRQKYGVTLQTTFVKVNDDGELVEKYVAYNDPVYESVKANLLD